MVHQEHDIEVYAGSRSRWCVEEIDDEFEEETPASEPLVQRPDVNGLIDYLLGAREAFRAVGGDIEGTLSISGPVAITIDL